MSHYIETVIDRLTTERDEAREALRATDAALQAVTALHVAWTELAVARGRILAVSNPPCDPSWQCIEDERKAKEVLVALGVAREAL